MNYLISVVYKDEFNFNYVHRECSLFLLFPMVKYGNGPFNSFAYPLPGSNWSIREKFRPGDGKFGTPEVSAKSYIPGS